MKKSLVFAFALLIAFALGAVVVRSRLAPYDAIDRWLRGDSGPEVERPPGLWGLASNDPNSERVSLPLGEIGYSGGYEPAPGEESVTVFEGGAYAGLNLVVSGHAPQAFLLDMQGKRLHSWQRELKDVWPNLTGFLPGYETFWRRAHVYPNGDLLAIFDGIGLFKLDRDSKLLWEHQGGEHHDIFVQEDGTIYTLSRTELKEHAQFELEGPIQEDFISILTPQGELVRRISVLSSLLDSDYRSALAHARRQGDILHTNTIEIMDGRFADKHPMFAEGNALISVRNVDTVCVVDLESERVVWALSGLWRMQHQPTVLENANLLVFDNLARRDLSRVIEIDPQTQEIVWSYAGSPERPLFSNFLGSCQRLANGNTLITESTRGRALEVNRGGEVVWEYFNPMRSGEKDELIASLFELVRIESAYFTDAFLETLAR